MAELLRSGHTMLNLACPICNNPIFQKKNGDRFCPVCMRKVIIEDPKNLGEDIKNQEDYQKKVVNIHNEVDSIKIKQVIIEKVGWISRKLKEETQLDMIEKYIKILSNLYDLLLKYSNLKF